MHLMQHPLHHAVAAQDETLICCMIESGANVNARNYNDQTPLHVLVSRDRDSEGFAPMSEAEKKSRTRIAEMLIKAGANLNSIRKINLGYDLSTYATVLYEAAYFDNRPMIDILLQCRADPNAMTSTGFTVLHKVLEQKDYDIDIVRSLLKYGCDVNAEYPGRTYAHHGGAALHLALMHDDCDLELVELLLEYGADVNKKNELGLNAMENYLVSAADIYPNSWDIRGINPELLRLIPISEKDVSPLHQACILYDADYVRELAMQPGVDVNARDALGYTPLFYAVVSRSDSAYDQLAKVRLLLDLGADINQTFIMNYQVEGSGSILDVAIRLRFRGREIYDVLVRHAAKLVELNDGDETRALSKFNLHALYTYEPKEWTTPLVDFPKPNYSQCIEELREMKRCRLGDTKITFFDLLTADVKKSVVYAKNRQIAEEFEDIFREGKFPIYMEWMLGTNFGKAFERRQLLDTTSVMLCDALYFADPTDVFYEKTLAHLSNDDLRSLLDSEESFDDSFGSSYDSC